MEWMRNAIRNNRFPRDKFVCLDNGKFLSSRRIGPQYYINKKYKFVSRDRDLFYQILNEISPPIIPPIQVQPHLIRETSNGYISIDYRFIFNKEMVAISRGDGTDFRPEDTEFLYKYGFTWQTKIWPDVMDEPRIKIWMDLVNGQTVPCSTCYEKIRIGSATLINPNGQAVPPLAELPDPLPKGIWQCWHCIHDAERVLD